MKKLYSLTVNDSEVVSVEAEHHDFMPSAPRLDRQWLKGIVTEAVSSSTKKARRRATRPAEVAA